MPDSTEEGAPAFTFGGQNTPAALEIKLSAYLTCIPEVRFEPAVAGLCAQVSTSMKTLKPLRINALEPELIARKRVMPPFCAQVARVCEMICSDD